jgi:two-component system, NtrC family, nitrogen regulation sensor histidine kinase NtrY
VLIDIHWFKQAIINILRNALRYNPPDSDLFIEAFAIDEANVQLEIQDNGTGVPEASIDERFSTNFIGFPDHEAVGLGLDSPSRRLSWRPIMERYMPETGNPAVYP